MILYFRIPRFYKQKIIRMPSNQIIKNFNDNEIIEKIYIIRGQKVMLDRDLAEMYGVETGVLNQAVKRNISRFPEDFMFQLDNVEYKSLISQIVISKKEGRGGSFKYSIDFTSDEPVAIIGSLMMMMRFSISGQLMYSMCMSKLPSGLCLR